MELLDCDEAGVLLADAAGVLRVMASSSERADAWELLQAQNDEGPCFGCFARAVPVTSHDLETDWGRWPAFSPAALGHGFFDACAADACPGPHGGYPKPVSCHHRGYRSARYSARSGDGRIAAVALIQERNVRESRVVEVQLQAARSSEQAKGCSARAQVTVDAALTRIRDYARAKISQVARELLDGTAGL